MIFPFGACEQLGDVVVTESPAQSHRPRFGAVRPGRRRIQDRIEADPQGGIDNLLERLAKLLRSPFRFSGYIRIERQRGSHSGIMMFL